MFAEVAVAVPGLGPLTYRIPEGEPVEPGFRVAVPLGRRVVNGVVVQLTPEAPKGIARVRAITRVLDERPALNPELLKLGQWIADYYVCSWGEALAAMLPGPFKPLPRERLSLSELSDPWPTGLKGQILERLKEKPQARSQLLADLPATAGRALNELIEQGIILQTLRWPRTRGPQAYEAGERSGLTPPPTLSSQQVAAWEQVRTALDRNDYHAFLLHGVTGSGKTEVYLQAMAHVLAQGRGAIMLVPEIALTPQAWGRITARLPEPAVVLHSHMTPAERAAAWLKLRTGEVRVALGARSAVFAPVQRLGLIVVDEEFEGSYKQEDTPRYHARDVAAMRARDQGAVLLLGSATPSVETYHNALSGRYTLLTMPERVDRKQLPEVRLVDLARALQATGNLPLISEELAQAVTERLGRGEQSILFLNRRGYAPVVLCPNCRYVMTCTDCSVNLVYHQADHRLHCHACGRTLSPGPACPRCGTACVRLAGAGTQRVMEELERAFPQARLLRVDQDAIQRRGALEEAFDQFQRREADILVGTQMVAKGLDFPGVTLVGIISADTALHLPDFRAEERTFQLLVQVAGRAGRGDRPGLVLAQTMHPEHPILRLAQAQDYLRFYDRELEQREALNYPPFSRLALIECRAPTAPEALQLAETIAERLRGVVQTPDQVLGPAPSPRERQAKEARFQVLIKASSVSRRARLLAALNGLKPSGKARFLVDVDPQTMM